MRRILFAVAFAPLVVAQRPTSEIRSDAAQAVFDLGGGSLVAFKLKDGMNPLAWLGPADENVKLRPMAHFLCLDRWGQPHKRLLKKEPLSFPFGFRKLHRDLWPIREGVYQAVCG